MRAIFRKEGHKWKHLVTLFEPILVKMVKACNNYYYSHFKITFDVFRFNLVDEKRLKLCEVIKRFDIQGGLKNKMNISEIG